MGITITAAGAFRETGASFFFPRRAHLLTTSSSQASYPSTHRKAAGLAHYAAPPLPTKQALRGSPVRRWYPSLQSGRALFTKHPQDASPEGQTMPQRFPAVIVCAAGRRLAPCLPLRCKPLSSDGTTRHPPAKTCQRQLYRSYGRMLPRTVHFLLSRQKKQNRPLQGAERT